MPFASSPIRRTRSAAFDGQNQPHHQRGRAAQKIPGGGVGKPTGQGLVNVLGNGTGGLDAVKKQAAANDDQNDSNDAVGAHGRTPLWRLRNSSIDLQRPAVQSEERR